MKLFDLFRKKNKQCGSKCDCKQNKVEEQPQEEMALCSCGNMCKVSDIKAKEAQQKLEKEVSSNIKVLGSGCKKCMELEKATKIALEELGRDTTIEHVTDFAQIASYGVMVTPALVVDGKVLSSGKVLSKDEVKSLIVNK